VDSAVLPTVAGPPILILLYIIEEVDDCWLVLVPGIIEPALFYMTPCMSWVSREEGACLVSDGFLTPNDCC
jgi:hypothetical protein